MRTRHPRHRPPADTRATRLRRQHLGLRVLASIVREQRRAVQEHGADRRRDTFDRERPLQKAMRLAGQPTQVPVPPERGDQPGERLEVVALLAPGERRSNSSRARRRAAGAIRARRRSEALDRRSPRGAGTSATWSFGPRRLAGLGEPVRARTGGSSPASRYRCSPGAGLIVTDEQRLVHEPYRASSRAREPVDATGPDRPAHRRA